MSKQNMTYQNKKGPLDHDLENNRDQINAKLKKMVEQKKKERLHKQEQFLKKARGKISIADTSISSDPTLILTNLTTDSVTFANPTMDRWTDSSGYAENDPYNSYNFLNLPSQGIEYLEKCVGKCEGYCENKCKKYEDPNDREKCMDKCMYRCEKKCDNNCNYDPHKYFPPEKCNFDEHLLKCVYTDKNIKDITSTVKLGQIKKILDIFDLCDCLRDQYLKSGDPDIRNSLFSHYKLALNSLRKTNLFCFEPTVKPCRILLPVIRKCETKWCKNVVYTCIISKKGKKLSIFSLMNRENYNTIDTCYDGSIFNIMDEIYLLVKAVECYLLKCNNDVCNLLQ